MMKTLTQLRDLFEDCTENGLTSCEAYVGAVYNCQDAAAWLPAGFTMPSWYVPAKERCVWTCEEWLSIFFYDWGTIKLETYKNADLYAAAIARLQDA